MGESLRKRTVAVTERAVQKDKSFLQKVDLYLLLLRWIVVTAGILLSFFGRFTNETILQLPLGATLIIAWNGLLSVYIVRRQPFASGRTLVLLFADAVQAGLATLLLGGYQNTFFSLFLLLVIELALAFPMRLAVAWILSAGALHIATVILNPVGRWSALSAYMTAGRFLILIIMGVLAIAFSEQFRHEDQARQMALGQVNRLILLNELFFRLNQPDAKLEGTFNELLNGAQTLLNAEIGMALICDTELGCWKLVVDHGATPHPSLINIADLNWRIDQTDVFTAGPAYHQPLPGLSLFNDLDAVVGIRLNSPGTEEPWILVIGRHGTALNSEEWLLFRALGREAELALRNARLHASEHAHLVRLQEFEETRTTFFSGMAHELRTPLTVLKTLTPSFEMWDQLMPSQRVEINDILNKNLDRLETLIDDFLESMRLEAGMVILHRQLLDISQLVQNALGSLQPLFQTKQLQVSSEQLPDGTYVNVDRRRVEQILSSLLHNAYKFTKDGGMIRCTLRRDEDKVQICVEDNGPGVPAGIRKHIFEKFYSASVESGSAGVGLGLFISHELVALHGGRLWYEDRPGGGSRFCFTLPVTEEMDAESDYEDTGH
jgi:signal transduction histidine kinase